MSLMTFLYKVFAKFMELGGGGLFIKTKSKACYHLFALLELLKEPGQCERSSQ